MGDGTEQNPLTREDVLKAIEASGGPENTNLSEKWFEKHIDLRGLNNNHLQGITLDNARFPPDFRRDITTTRGARLKGVHLEGAHLRSAHLEEADLSDAHLEEADLRDAYVEGTLLARIEFTDKTNFEDVHWGKKYVFGKEKKESMVSTYRRLKQWHTSNGLYNIAGVFYYREMEASRKQTTWSSKHWYRRLMLEVSRAFFGYGEDWKLVLGWMAVVVLGSALAYYLGGGLDPLYSLYFSVVSFTALGYGKWVNIIPQGWMQALGAVESFIGVFLMALLLVTFFRKWIR